MRVSPAKAAINSGRAIAEERTGAWSPCPESSASRWPAQSSCRLKAEGVRPTGLKLQNLKSDAVIYKIEGRWYLKHWVEVDRTRARRFAFKKNSRKKMSGSP